MIVREYPKHFVMITQHDHAGLSGVLASHIQGIWFRPDCYDRDTLLAISEHDRGWIRLDERPLWDDLSASPYSFINYPLLPKLPAYKSGLDEVEHMSKYAGLLCSMHYSSFHHIQTSTERDWVQFYETELKRQQRIKKDLNDLDENTLSNHFKVLKLCDALSLYVCLNEPGSSKENEHPWYRDGFKTDLAGLEHLIAHWSGPQEITFNPALFGTDFTAVIKMKYVDKYDIERLGLEAAYTEADWAEQEFKFKNGEG